MWWSGMKIIEMNFSTRCRSAMRKMLWQNRYNRETLEVRYKGKSYQRCVLNMTVEDSLEFFESIPNIFPS